MSSWGWRLTAHGVLEAILFQAHEAGATSVQFDVDADAVLLGWGLSGLLDEISRDLSEPLYWDTFLRRFGVLEKFQDDMKRCGSGTWEMAVAFLREAGANAADIVMARRGWMNGDSGRP